MMTGHQPDPIEICCPLCKEWANHVEIRRIVLPQAIRRERRCSFCGQEWWSCESVALNFVRRYAQKNKPNQTMRRR